ncbi:carbon-nitrogen hydrolase family protein [Nitrospira sp. Nam74]
MMNLNRRQFLQASVGGLASTLIAHTAGLEAGSTRTLRIALLHLAPRAGDLAYNRRLLEKALVTAAEWRAAWILTPELSTTGYTFADEIGTDWIVPQPDPWMKHVCGLISRLNVTVFLSVPERDPHTQKLHNSVCVIASDGTVIGCHRKINTLRVGSESWSNPGERVVPLPVPPFDLVGILICADAFSPDIAESLKAQEAQFLVSAAAWAPGLHGPNGEWERCTRDTGLPLLVCNRTGPDRTLNFTEAQSVVVKDGRRLLSMSSERSAIFVIDWDTKSQNLVSQEYQRVFL